MNSVVTFTFADHSIRVVKDRRGTYWFVGRDICFALGLTNPNVSMTARWETAVPKLVRIKDRLGRDTKVRVLTDAEAVDLIQRTQVPHPDFERWFVHEVLPQLEARVDQPTKVK
jgi:prophage antirepressor-like protein